MNIGGKAMIISDRSVLAIVYPYGGQINPAWGAVLTVVIPHWCITEQRRQHFIWN